MIKNIYALDNRTIPISPGRGKSAPFVSRFIFHKQMNIIHIQIISNNCKIKTQRKNSNKIISAQQLLSFQVSDSKNNQPFTASGRLSRSSLVNLAPSSTSAPSLAILLAITGALPPKMDLWSDMANAVSVSSLNSVLLLTNLLKTQQSHILLYYFNGALLMLISTNYQDHVMKKFR